MYGSERYFQRTTLAPFFRIDNRGARIESTRPFQRFGHNSDNVDSMVAMKVMNSQNWPLGWIWVGREKN